VENTLELFLKSRSPMIWCSSLEEDRTVFRIQAVAENLQFATFEWTCTEGFVQLSEGNLRQPGDGCCTNIDQALRAVGEYKHARAVFIFRDFHLLASRIDRAPEYVTLVRGLKRLYRTLKASGNTIVFVASSPVIPEELKDCLTLLETTLPNADERLEIIKAWIETNCRDIPCSLDEETIHRVVSISAGMSSRQIQSALGKSAVKRKGLTPELVDDMLAEKISVVKTSELLTFVQVEETLESVGGLKAIKDFMIRRTLAFGRAAARYGLPKPKGVLFLRPPGVGKSLMAKVSANVLQIPLLRFDIGRLQGSLVGQSEERMRLALALAETQSPCALWVDELEKAFGGVSGPVGDSGVLRRQFGYMLNWMQEHESPVFIVATANNIRQLPPEFLRKGRFDEIFFVDLPTPAEREAIMKVLLGKYGQNPKGLVTESLIDKLDKFTGAEMEYVVIEGIYEAFYDNQRLLSAKDLEVAASRIVPIADQMRNEIEELRRWGKVNARPAS
jgi:ATP-dependent 26S proteasome regulatory subunit